MLDSLSLWLHETPLGETLLTMLISMLPVVELRGGLPAGVAMGLPIPVAFIASLVGNMIPVPFIILFVRPLFKWVRIHIPKLEGFISHLEARAEAKSADVLRYQTWGLLIFVAIPLPGTGAWTGALIAAVLNMRLKRAVPVIFLGVVIAGCIITLLTHGVTLCSKIKRARRRSFLFLFVSKLQPFCNDFRLKSCYHPYRRRLCGKHRKGEFHMKKHLQCGLTAALTLALLLTVCGQKEADANDTPPDAQAGSLYEDFFTGDVTVTANLINAGVEATTASFHAPAVYATKGVDGSDMDWTITRFALLDLDGDGADELVLNIDFSGEEEYVILTCYDGAVYANQIVYRGFLSPKADGTFEWSNGAFDNGASRACFENGVLVYEDFASMSEGSDGNAVYTLNGESIDEAAYSAFLDEQAAKDDLAWTEFSVDAVNAALAG